MGTKIQMEREKRLPVIYNLIGTGMTSQQIADEVGINIRTYFKDVKILKERMSHKDTLKEACLKVKRMRESTIEKAEYQYANASDEKTKISALQTLNKIHDSTEKTYARLGLIPNERTGLDVMAEVHTHEELFDIYEECKKEKRESGESGLETKT
jgi:hypothetical protein